MLTISKWEQVDLPPSAIGRSARITLLTIVALLMPTFAFGAEPIGASDRMPGNEESWIALAIVLGSVFAAWFLNHETPFVRVMGTVLAAIGCFTVAAWFFAFVLSSGFLENPKPYDAPMDAAKPALLWIQSMVALIAGAGLLVVAHRQWGAGAALDLGSANEPDRYGRVSRVLHWTIAILFIAMIPMGIFATIVPYGTPWRLEYYVVHKTIGVIIFALAIFRVFWNRRSRRPALGENLRPVERKLAHHAHNALYVMMFAMPVTGFIMTSYFGAPTYFFAWELPPLWGQSEVGANAWGVLHKYLLPYLIYVILGAHILGALKHQFIDKHNIFGRMVS